MYVIRMPMRTKNKASTVFGKTLKLVRKSKGLTQTELGEKAGISTRMIAHYENWAGCPPVEKMILLAKVLDVSLDELLGLKQTNKEILTEHPKLWNKFKKLEELPKSERQTITKLLDTYYEKLSKKTEPSEKS